MDFRAAGVDMGFAQTTVKLGGVGIEELYPPDRLIAAAREPIAAGYGPAFLHRTGHGIGLDGHEEPYLVAGNDRPLEAFSIEPGIYLAGRHGARIEDIVVCTTDGVQRLNTTPTELIAL